MALRSHKEGKLSSAMVSVALQDSIAREVGLTAGPVSSRRGCGQCGRRAGRAGRREKRREVREDGVEYVLDQAPPPLTLAQRHGLAPAPTPLLTEEQWREVKRVSRSRGDFSQPCPICQDQFRLKEQVLLSCSHSFHRVCLSSFERYSGRKCCPMCRSVHYQTRVINEAAALHRHKSATKIQSFWRMCVVKKWYTQYRQRVPPSDPRLRERHFEKKLTSLADAMVKCCHNSSEQVDQFLSSLDKDVESARNTMSLLDAHTKQRSSTNKIDWREIEAKALRTDCVICLSVLTHSRQLSLLSCGHILHFACISSFEKFTSTTATATPHQCPICRSVYHRQQFTIQHMTIA